MSMRLKNSRGLFFKITKEPQKSFWAHPDFISLVEAANGRPIPKEILNWDPCAEGSRSNCPMLQDTLDMLVKLVDPRWRARVKNIYAGRTYSNDDMAQADKNLRGGMVAISNEYTAILFAYAAMYDNFIHSVDLANKLSATDSDALWRGMHKELDESIESYRIGGILALKGKPLMVFPNEEFRQNAYSGSSVAEAWTIAHELSHHLVRDMSARRDKGVEAIIKELTSYSSIGQEIRNMSRSQRDEIEADLLATLILAGHFTPQNRPPLAAHNAITAGALSLIAIAHLRNEWTTDPADSHPGCFDRLRILLTIMSEIYGNQIAYPNDPEREHMLVYRAAGLLMTYGHWAKGLMDDISELGLPHGLDSRSMNYIIATYTTEFGIAADEYAERTMRQ
ncbi:hypothetical protein [Rhodococcus ruber]|uniref:hypothetical protein n=1 Tax=Rhodococcus ruber TaxID=1830 RepID=UPI000AB6C76A|nr:hypothetical protein [Rhodococcus ruber]